MVTVASKFPMMLLLVRIVVNSVNQIDNSNPRRRVFFASLFDVSMQEMITPKIVRIIYILGLIGIGIGTLIAFISYLTAASYSGSVFPVLAAVIIVPLCALLAVIYLRVVLELIVLAFNIYDELKEIRRGHTANSCRK